jgi:hypothetical protein
MGSIDRPHYGHCLLHAGLLARKLGYPRISAIEFGVAAGNGLLALERHAEVVTKETGVEVATYGFDTGVGLPPPRDYRDMPYLYQAGDFTMDVEKLEARLKSSKLILGPVSETVPRFFHHEHPSPIGFAAFDLDYYSSTVDALRIFDSDHKHFLPRVSCYFDDIAGDIDWAYNEFTGELLAIKEFNATHEDMKIAPVQGFRYRQPKPQLWHEKVFVAHRFRHPDYGRPISDLRELPLIDERTHKLLDSGDQTAAEIADLVAAGGAFVLVDERWLAPEALPERRAIPFLERDGQYWGPPADDPTAIRELERLRRAGAGHIVFAWPAFWWLEHYAGFHRHLRSRFRCALENERLVVFDLRSE